MTVLFILGLLCAGAAGAFILRAILFPYLRIATLVRQIDTYGFGSDAPGQSKGVAAGPVSRFAVFAGVIGSWVITHVPMLKPVSRREMMAAGMYNLSVEVLQGYRVLGAAALPLLILLFRLITGSLTVQVTLLIIVMWAIAWLLPAATVRSRGQRRLDRIDGELPELIDVLTATIEAGLGFAGSLQLCAERFDGPLGQELRLTLQEQTMGLSSDAALANMRERCNTPSVRAFVRAVGQGESLGVSIGTMMRNLATDTRKRRRTLAQERIQKAPVKMLFPLVLLIFPALFIVLLYPALHNVLAALGGH